MALWLLFLVLIFSYLRADAKTITFRNNCEVTLWPGLLSNAGQPQLVKGGFQLPPHSTATISPPTGWPGRFWARSGCTFNTTGKGQCTTGDCGGVLQCNGAGGVPPATLAEFSLDNPRDFYDISLVDGFNIPISIVPSLRNCPKAECARDLNNQCRRELQVISDGKVVACKSACLAFGTPEYCCTGSYGNPNTCKPSAYSKEFKAACPTAYSYAYDDPNSLFTCQGADYSIIFC